MGFILQPMYICFLLLKMMNCLRTFMEHVVASFMEKWFYWWERLCIIIIALLIKSAFLPSYGEVEENI